MQENPENENLPELSEEEKYHYEQMIIEKAFENSYQVLTKKTTFEKLMTRKEKYGMRAILIYDPSEDPDELIYDDMIHYFEDLEEYERCAELLSIKNKMFKNV